VTFVTASKSAGTSQFRECSEVRFLVGLRATLKLAGRQRGAGLTSTAGRPEPSGTIKVHMYAHLTSSHREGGLRLTLPERGR